MKIITVTRFSQFLLIQLDYIWSKLWFLLIKKDPFKWFQRKYINKEIHISNCFLKKLYSSKYEDHFCIISIYWINMNHVLTVLLCLPADQTSNEKNDWQHIQNVPHITDVHLCFLPETRPVKVMIELWHTYIITTWWVNNYNFTLKRYIS